MTNPWLCRRAVLMLGMTAVGLPCVLAAPLPVPDVQSIAQRSDLIVVATVDRTDVVGTSTVSVGDHAVGAKVVQAQLVISSVLKGYVSANRLPIQYAVPTVPIGYRSLAVGQVRVLFLAVKDDGGYTFANPYFPSMPGNAGANLGDSDITGKLLDEEQSVLTSGESIDPDKTEAVYAISLIKDARAVGALLPGLSDPSIAIRLEVAGELTTHNNVNGASVSCEALLEKPNGVPAYVFHNLRVGIRDGVKDAQMVPCLAQLLHSKDDSSREAAASALRHTHCSAAVNPLALALDDPDEQVRYQAVGGLAEISGQTRWRLNLIEFHSDGERFVQHWKAWVSSQ